MSHMRTYLPPVLLVLLSLMTLGFVTHAFSTGVAALAGDSYVLGRLYAPAGWFSNSSISLHMVAGAVITCLAPLQIISTVRNRWPRLHRLSGYLIVSLSIAAALGGFGYMIIRGTVGGPLMTVGFTLYGMLMLICAVQTARFARERRFGTHRRWALRLFVLAIGSWLYRLHYGVWFAATGGMASNLEFTGFFDQIQVFAFYLPYLLLLELVFRIRRTPMTT